MKSIDQALLASLDLVFALDVNGQFIYISDLTAQLFGSDRPSLTHQPLTRTQLPPAIIDALSTSHQEILGSGRPTAGQLELEVTYSASPKYYDYTFSPVWGRSNQIEATIFIAKDITERQHAEVALRDSEVKYRTLFEAASDIILILDCDDYSILNANWTAARQLGYSRMELMRLSLREIEDAFDSTRQEQLIETLEIEGSAIYERVYRHKQGTTFPVEINAQLIEYGDQLCIQSFVRDITERRQAEHAIREQQRQLAAIAANFPGALYREVVHPDGTISIPYISGGETPFTGFTPEQIRDNPALLSESVHPADRPYFEEELRRCRRTLDILDIEYRNISPDGTVFWLREMAKFSRTESGDVVADGFSLDITDRKEAKLALEKQFEQERILRRITENIHRSLDLNTVLQTTANLAQNYLNIERVAIHRYDAEYNSEILNQAVSHKRLEIQDTRIPKGPWIEDYLTRYQLGQPLTVDDVYHSDLPPAFLGLMEQLQVQSHLVIPILLPSTASSTNHSTQLWGAVILDQCSHGHRWLATEIELMQQIATQLGIAIHQSELYQWLQTELHERIRAEAEVRSLNEELQVVNEELRLINEELEQRVAQRTQALQTTNEELEQEIRERIRTAEALQQSEKRFRDLVETTNDLVWEEDANGIFTYMSPQSLEILGYDPDELVGTPCFDIMDSKSRQALKAGIKAAKVGNLKVFKELTAIHKDGRHVILESGIVAKFDNQGQFAGFRGIDRDITARKEAEEKLQRYERIVSATADGIALIDRAYKYQVVNQSYSDRLGRSPNEMVGLLMNDLFSEDVFEQRIRPGLERCWNGEIVQYEAWFQFEHTDDEQVYLSVKYSPYVEPDGSIIGAVVSTRDITELKQVELALRESESQLQQIFDNVQDVFFLKDFETGQTIFINSAFETLFQIPRHEVYERPQWINQLHPDDLDRVLAILQERNTSPDIGASFGDMEYRIMRPDGSIRWVWNRTFPIRNEAGEIYRFAGVNTDITERKETEQENLLLSERLEFLLASSPAVIYSCAATNTYDATFISKNVAVTLGYSPEDFLQTPSFWASSIHPDDAPQIFAELSSLFEFDMHQHEYRFLHHDGHYVWLRDELRLVRDADGQPLEIVGCMLDITDRKQAELDLRESEAKNRALVNALPDLVMRISRDGIYLDFFSTDAFRVIGTRDLIGQSVTEGSLPPHLIQQRLNAIHQVLDTRKLQIYEQEVTVDGDRQIEEVRVVACDDDSALLLVRDITDRKQAEDALQQSESRFQTLVTNMPGMVYRYHPGIGETGAFTYASIGSEDLFELTPEQVIEDANAVWSLIQTDDLVLLQRSVAFAVEHCLDWQWEGRLTTASGQDKWIQGRSRPQVTPEGIVWDGILIDITNRKQAEDALRQSERRYATLTEMAPVGIFRFDADGECVYLNSRWYELTGLSTGEGYGDDWMKALHPDDRDRLLAGWRNASTQAIPMRQEGRHLRPDGSINWFDCQMAPEFDADGDLLGYVGTISDITERKQAEDALRQSERRYATLTEMAPVGIFRFDANGDCVYLNPRWYEMTGLPTGAGEGDGWMQALHPDDRNRILESTKSTYEQRLPARNEGRHLHPNGSITWFDCQMAPELDADGTFLGYVGTVSDVTERKQVELILRESEQRFQEIASTISQFFFIRSAQTGEFIYISPAYETIWGRTCDSLYENPSSWMDAIHPDDRPRIDQSVAEQFDGHSVTREYRIVRPDGEIRWIFAQITFVRNEANEVNRFIGFATDISDRKQAAEALRISEERLRTLINTLPFGVWAYDAGDRVVLQNPVDVSRFGNLQGTHINDLEVSPELIDQYWEVKQRCQLEGSVSLETTAIIQGEERSFLRISAPLPDQNGEMGLLGVAIDITQQKQAELALRDSEQRYSTLAESSPVGIFRFDASGQCIYVNSRWCAMTGRSASDAYGDGWQNALHPDDFELAAWHKALEQPSALRSQGRHLLPDGTIRWIDSQMVPEYDATGKFMGYIGTVSDITERKQAEEALRLSEERLRALVDSLPCGVWARDAEDRLILQNPVDVAYYGDKLGTSVEELGLTPDLIAYYEEVKRRCQAGEVVSVETTEEVNGEERTFHRLVTVLRESNGRMGTLGVAIDVTEQRRTAKALQTSEDRLRRLIDALPLGIWLRDAGDRLVLQNQEDIDRYGNIIGTRLDENDVPPERLDRYEQVKEQCLAGNVVRYENTETIHGEDRTFLRINATLPDFEGGMGIFGAVIDITERKRTEQALAISEERLKRLIDALPIGIWMYDANNYLILQNQEDIARYGQMLGTHLDDIGFSEEQLTLHSSVREQCLAGEDVVQYEAVEVINGQERTLLRISAALPDFEGGIGMFGASIDISEQKHIEHQLRESEERYRSIVETANEGIWLIDANSETTYVNPRMAEMLGYTTEEMTGKSLFDFMDDEGRAICTNNVERRRLGIAEQHDFKFQHKDGFDVWTMISTTPLTDASGAYAGSLGMITDISDRKHIENDLRQSEERFRAIFENVGIGMALLEAPEWNLTMTNPAFQRLIGYSADELATLEYTDFTHPDDLAIEAPLVRECIEGDRTSYTLEKRYIHKDGETVWVHLTASIVRDERHRAKQSIFTIEDITARKRSEESARRATNALLEVEARQRLILEAIPDLMHLFDADGTLLDSIRNIPGKNLLPNPSQAIGRNLLELIPQALAERQIQGIQTALETGEIQIFEQQIEGDAFREAHEREGVSLISDGYKGVRYEEVRIVPTANNQVLILVRDISDRKHAELALAQSEYRQRTILRVIPELIGWFNRDGVFLEWYGAETIRDLVPSHINPIGKSYHEVVPPDIASRLTTIIQHALDTGIEQHYDQQIQFGDTVQHEEIIVVPTDEDEALMVVRDVSDRKSLENYLRETRRTLQDILDHVDASIIRVHAFDAGDLSTEFISAGCEAVFGYTADELMGDRTLWMSRVPIDDVETIVIPSRQRVCETGHDSITYRFRHKNGELRHIHSRAIAHRDNGQRCWVITAIETVLHPPT